MFCKEVLGVQLSLESRNLLGMGLSDFFSIEELEKARTRKGRSAGSVQG